MSLTQQLLKHVQDMESTIQRQAARIAELEAARTEPVAWIAVDGNGTVWRFALRPRWSSADKTWNSSGRRVQVVGWPEQLLVAPGECVALHLGEKIVGATAQPELQPVHRADNLTVFAFGDKVAVVRCSSKCGLWRVDDSPMTYRTREEAEDVARKKVEA